MTVLGSRGMESHGATGFTPFGLWLWVVQVKGGSLDMRPLWLQLSCSSSQGQSAETAMSEWGLLLERGRLRCRAIMPFSALQRWAEGSAVPCSLT